MPGYAHTRAATCYPSIKRRLVCMVYELLLLFGVAFFAGMIFIGAMGTASSGWLRHAFQIYLFLMIGLYFVWSWHNRGETLAMKAWKLRIAAADGSRITLRQAMLRYVWAWPCLALGGVGIAYALLDRERQFLHDRLARTRVLLVTDAGEAN